MFIYQYVIYTQTVWAPWSVGVGMVWLARSAAEGKRHRWAIASRAARRRTPALRDRVGRKEGWYHGNAPADDGV